MLSTVCLEGCYLCEKNSAPDVLDGDGLRQLHGVPAAAGVQAEVHLLRGRRAAVHRHDDDAPMVPHLVQIKRLIKMRRLALLIAQMREQLAGQILSQGQAASLASCRAVGGNAS